MDCMCGIAVRGIQNDLTFLAWTTGRILFFIKKVKAVARAGLVGQRKGKSQKSGLSTRIIHFLKVCSTLLL